MPPGGSFNIAKLRLPPEMKCRRIKSSQFVGINQTTPDSDQLKNSISDKLSHSIYLISFTHPLFHLLNERLSFKYQAPPHNFSHNHTITKGQR